MKLFFTLPIILLVVSCNAKKETVSDKPETFKVVNPTLIDTIYTKEYIADIHSLQNVEIRTHVKGFIEKIHIDEGKAVKAGQLLFSLGNREFRENLLKAQANFKSIIAEIKVAEVELKNTRTLADKKIVSNTELEMAIAKKEALEAKLEEAKAAVSIAKLNLSYTEVRAPFNGVINRIPYKTGSLVSEGDLLTTISNNQEVFAYFNLSEREFLDLKKKGDQKNAEVNLMLANNEIFSQTGRIETVENEIDKGTGNIAFRARFKNPGLLLKHGSSGKVLVREELTNAMVIPQKATFEIQDKIYVYTVDQQNRIRMRNISPALRLTHLYVIESGLDTGDRLIFEGIQQVKEGEQILPQPITLSDASFR
jgi:membrane fusion protein (multidrug efflux system)